MEDAEERGQFRAMGQREKRYVPNNWEKQRKGTERGVRAAKAKRI